MTVAEDALSLLEDCGYAMLPQIFDASTMQQVVDQLGAALRPDSAGQAVLQSRGQTYGARDLLSVFPQVVQLVRDSALPQLVRAALGDQAGMVRGLFFDKPPSRSWALPWHRDLTIAVQDHSLPSQHFRNPTRKAGVPHVEAPRWLLRQMLTLRIHLDPMTAENGPLSVVPASHLVEESAGDEAGVSLRAGSGDVLAMRPLLLHCSALSAAGTTLHRRIVHLELAPVAELPDGYAWRAFHPL